MSAPRTYRDRVRAILSSGLPTPQRMALLAIADHLASSEDYCWPSQKRLRELSGMAERTLRRHLQAMAAAEVLYIEKGNGGVDRFMIAWDALTGSADPGQSGRTPPANLAAPPPGQSGRTPPANLAAPPANLAAPPGQSGRTPRPDWPPKGVKEVEKEEGKEDPKLKGGGDEGAGRRWQERGCTPLSSPPPPPPEHDEPSGVGSPSPIVRSVSAVRSCWLAAHRQVGLGAPPVSIGKDPAALRQAATVLEAASGPVTVAHLTAALVNLLQRWQAGRAFPPLQDAGRRKRGLLYLAHLHCQDEEQPTTQLLASLQRTAPEAWGQPAPTPTPTETAAPAAAPSAVPEGPEPDCWSFIQAHLKEKLGLNTYAIWIRGLSARQSPGLSLVTLWAPNAYYADWVLTHYAAALAEQFQVRNLSVQLRHLEHPEARPVQLSAVPAENPTPGDELAAIA